MIFNVQCWVLVGSHFGIVLETQMEAKSIKKRFSKVSQSYDENYKMLIDVGGPLGSKMEPQIDHH